MCSFCKQKAKFGTNTKWLDPRCTSENPFLHTIICLNERRNDNLVGIISFHIICSACISTPPPPSTAFFNRPKKGDDGTTYTLEIWADSCPVFISQGLVRLPFVNIIILPMYSLMLCLLFFSWPTHSQ